MVNAKHAWQAIVLGIGLVVSGGNHDTKAEDPKPASPSAPPVFPEGSIPVPETIVASLSEAMKATERKDWATAQARFAEILEKEPSLGFLRFSYARALVRDRKPSDAVVQLDKALGSQPTFEELFAAGAILQGGRDEKATSQPDLAATYFHRALAAAMNGDTLQKADLDELQDVAELTLRFDQKDQFDKVVDALRTRFPDARETHLNRGIQAAMNQSWLEAEDELAQAKALGMAVLAPGTMERIHELARPMRYAWLAAYAVGAVLGGLVILFVLGRLLSFLTLRSAERADPNLAITPLERGLRKVYRVVINLAGLYYYICLPFVILIAIGIVIGLGYLVFSFGRIHVKAVALLVGFAFAMLVMIWSSLRSLFVRLKDEDPGRSLTAEEAPKLWEMTRDVASAVGTRPVDAIYLTPGTELAVFERGSWLQKLRDRSKRSLILGLGVLDGFRTNDFRAVLAHEYGHFLHRDTAGGDVALRVNATMSSFAIAMAQQGQLEWWNIGWQFVRLYHLLFRRITHGASRLQEINADRVAARLCGPKAFEGGLRHVIRCDVGQKVKASRSASQMERIAGASAWTPQPGQDPVAHMLQLLETKRADDHEPWWDVYSRAETRRQVDQVIARIWNVGASEDDTHPSPFERIRLISRLKCPEAPSDASRASTSEGFLEDLFADPKALRVERTKQVVQMVAVYVAQTRLDCLEAVEGANFHLQSHPGDRDALLHRAQAKLALRDFAGAEADCSELLKPDGPRRGVSYYVRGLARAAIDKNEEAVADLREALDRDPSLAENGRVELGDALMQAGRPSEAAEEYTKAIAMAPEELHLYLRRGDALTRADRFAQADVDYSKALELDAQSAEALALRALERAQAGQHAEAQADAQAALAIDPLITETIATLGQLQVKEKVASEKS
jgi:tetratricopeptide (TPR) repeat protein